MVIELTEDERAALLELVEREISDLGPEIHHTKVNRYREDLRVRKQALKEVCEHLRVPQTV